MKCPQQTVIGVLCHSHIRMFCIPKLDLKSDSKQVHLKQLSLKVRGYDPMQISGRKFQLVAVTTEKYINCLLSWGKVSASLPRNYVLDK